MIGIKEFLNYRSLADLTLSPDGNRAVFTVIQPMLEGNCYQRDLWLLDTGSGKTRLLRSGYAFSLTWLDQAHVGFAVSLEDGKTAYMCLDTDSGEECLLDRFPEGTLGVWPLQDGAYAFMKEEHLPRKPYPAELQFLADHEEAFETLNEIPAYFNGQGFVSGCRRRLYVRDRSGDWLLTPETMNVDKVLPDASGLYFSARTYRGMNTEPGIYCMETGKAAPRAVVPEGKYRIHDWAVQEAGRVIFAAHDKDRHIMSDDPAFYTAADGQVTLLDLPEMSTGDGVGHDCVYGGGTAFIWDGALFFITTREEDAVIMRARPGEKPEAVTPGGYSINSFDRRAGRMLVIALGVNTLQEIYAVEDGKMVRLTRFSDGCLDPGQVTVPEKFCFENNGFRVHYLVLRPEGFREDKKYPAILYIHGGAKMCYTDAFFHEMQFLAGKGYFVLYGNPHGSDGQGSAFARLLGHYGEPDYEDIMAALEEALRRYPNIDPERLGVAGGSYGGIMTNWVITHTDRFKAAVAQRSICSMVSTFGTADNGFNFVREQMDGDLWDGFDNLWRQSPLKYANQCRTPLLLIHSDEDYRCHYSEAMQMFTALRYHGVEAEICLIHGENHNLSREGRPLQRIKRLYEIGNWFDRHLKGEGE